MRGFFRGRKPRWRPLARSQLARLFLPAALADAIKHLSDHWTGLVRFIQDPMIPLSNNRAERELRVCVLGRKNHYGSKSVRGTEVAALFYGLLESAKLCGVDPSAYLMAATKAILTDPNDVLLPYEYAARMAEDQTVS